METQYVIPNISALSTLNISNEFKVYLATHISANSSELIDDISITLDDNVLKLTFFKKWCDNRYHTPYNFENNEIYSSYYKRNIFQGKKNTSTKCIYTFWIRDEHIGVLTKPMNDTFKLNYLKYELGKKTKEDIIEFLCEQMVNYSNYIHFLPYAEKKIANPIKKNFLKFLYREGYAKLYIVLNKLNNEKFNNKIGHELVEFNVKINNFEYVWYYPLDKCDEFIPHYYDSELGKNIPSLENRDYEYSKRDDYSYNMDFEPYIKLLQQINDITIWNKYCIYKKYNINVYNTKTNTTFRCRTILSDSSMYLDNGEYITKEELNKNYLIL